MKIPALLTSRSSFPNFVRAVRDASLDDPDYQGIRARWFEPSVSGGVVRLGDYPVE
jgi:hypothetical protein